MCADEWHDNYENAPTDGSIWLDGIEERSPMRGGSFNDYPQYCRSAHRYDPIDNRHGRLSLVGFRVVCSVERFS